LSDNALSGISTKPPLRGERKRRAERKKKEAEAHARAEDLLKQMLSAAQKKEYETAREFTVVTESGKRYKIRHGWAGNVDEIDESGKAAARYCIHPTIGCPHPDNMLAQKLMLETDEKAFLKIANKTRLIA
jgi:hypothetical protein